MILRIQFILVLVNFYLLLPTVLIAEEYPASYPWRGVTIDSSTEEKFAPDELQKLKNILPGLNFVQLRLKPKKMARREKLSIEKATSLTIGWADMMLDECAKLNLVGLLSFEGFPLDIEKDYTHTSPQFWDNKKNLGEVVHTAVVLAMHFSKRGKELAAYQFISEPVVVSNKKAKIPRQWKGLLKKIIEAIRNNDPHRWIVVAPAPWGGPDGYKDFKPCGNKIIYGAHMYHPHSFTHQGIRRWKNKSSCYPNSNKFPLLNKNRLRAILQPLRDFQLKYNVPIYIGEFSAIRWAKGGEEYIKDLVTIFNEYNWGWAYFSLNGWHGWNPNYSNKKFLTWQKEWRKQYIGKKTTRWKSLRNLLKE